MIINGIRFAEDADNKSPTCRWAPENCSKTRRLLYPYDANPDNLEAAALALLGGTELVTETIAGVERAWISRRLPHFYPAPPTYENPDAEEFLFCASIPLAEPCSAPEGVDADGRSVYSWYRYSCVYETAGHNLYTDDDPDLLASGAYSGSSPLGAEPGPPAFPARPDEGDALRRGWANTRFITKSVKRASRTITLPQGMIKWQTLAERPVVGGPESVSQGVPYLQARAMVDYVWLCVPLAAVPEQYIQGALNRLNLVTFDKWPVGTLLLSDYDLRLYRSSTGLRVADVHYHFMFMPNFDTVTRTFNGFNSAPRVVNGKVRFWPISGDGAIINPAIDSDNKVFQHTDFANLFRAPFPFS